MHRFLLVLAAASVTEGYVIQQLPAVKGSWLLHTWSQAAITVRSNGFNPKQAEATSGDGALRMKDLANQLPKLVSQGKILGLCEKGTLSFDSLDEPHKSMAKRLKRTRMMAAISAGKGSALAFVSDWDDHVSIDACVVNPTYLELGMDAEAALLEHVTQAALEAGAAEIRLRPSFQVEGDAFYARCGFYPSSADADADGNAEDRVLYFQSDGPEARAAPTEPTASAGNDDDDAPEATVAATKAAVTAQPPAGFEWGVTL